MPLKLSSCTFVNKGVMYANTNHGQVVALNPATGELIWSFDPESYALGRPVFSQLKLEV